MPKISTELLKTGRPKEILRKQGVITEWEATLASLLSTRKFGKWWLTGLIYALASGKASVSAHSWLGCKVNQPCGTNWWEVGFTELQWLQSCFNFSFFVSCWLNNKLKGKRLISCRDGYEECVLPGISPSILSFPCVRGVKHCLLEAGGNSHVHGMPADVAEAF